MTPDAMPPQPPITVDATTKVAAVTADALVIFVGSCDGRADLGRGPAAAIDAATGGLLTRLAAAGELHGKPGECLTLLAPPGLRVGQLVVVGTGAAAASDPAAPYRAAATATRHLAAKPRTAVALVADPDWTARQTEQGVAGAAVGMVGQDLFRAERRRTPFPVVWLGADTAAVERGARIGTGVNLARRLVNMPPDDIYPASFAATAAAVAADTGLGCEIWDEARLVREGCRAILAVGKGSHRSPRIVLLTYRGPGVPEGPPHLALVGKGVTFDSGGLSLKPPDGMLTMKCDMAGAAATLAAAATIARLGLPIRLVAALGLAENMTGPAAYKLGDVIRARSGTTIEVHNTDAEGRIVLADVLDVVRGPGPAGSGDPATLTGACVVALGTEVAGLFTNDQAWCDRVATAARAVGEPVWQLPMYPEIYDDLIKGEVADIKNIGDGRWGGATTAAKFLERFVGGIPWTHVDIAGPAFAEKPRPWTDGGGSGAMVRAFVELARGLG
jgi:leucyl aminopeptidase